MHFVFVALAARRSFAWFSDNERTHMSAYTYACSRQLTIILLYSVVVLCVCVSLMYFISRPSPCRPHARTFFLACYFVILFGLDIEISLSFFPFFIRLCLFSVRVFAFDLFFFFSFICSLNGRCRLRRHRTLFCVCFLCQISFPLLLLFISRFLFWLVRCM